MSQYLIVNDMKYDYSFREITLMSLLILLVLSGQTDAIWCCTLNGQWLGLILPSSEEHREGDILEGLKSREASGLLCCMG